MCPWKTGVGKCPTWTSPNYWGYNHQQILESDVQNPLRRYIYQPLEKPSSIHDCCGGRRIGQETLLWRRRSPCSNPALQATSLLELVWLALPHKDLSELKKRRKITRNCWFMRDSLDNDNLVGGWATPLKNITQLGWLFPIYGKINSCSKPPTRRPGNPPVRTVSNRRKGAKWSEGTLPVRSDDRRQRPS